MKAKYYRLLEEQLKKMPFIYKDFESEVLEDYVDIEVQSINLNTLKPSQTFYNKKSLEKLNDNYKALFIGSAGMGKSTFFRYSVLSIIKKRDVSFLSSFKGHVPIFISLKSVPVFGKSPILNFIFQDIPLFKSNGSKKMENLTSSGKVFLLLDGYDEIGFASSQNSIKHELELLLSSTIIEKKINYGFIDPEYLQIYENTTRCKVWLSTREEFYRLNPLRIEENVIYDYATQINRGGKNFTAVLLKGLEENRLSLVKKVFDKYRSRSEYLEQMLDEEEFVEDIDTVEDEELIRMSKRPLFLIILCYIYVNKLTDNHLLGETGGGRWLSFLNELVLECIRVLLADLDKFKVRSLPEIKRNTFMKRRSFYIEEKLQFLKFFSLELLLNSVNVFNYSDVNNYAKIFFEDYYEGDNKTAIITDINDSKSNNPNIVAQLIFSGLFVVVNFNLDNLLYDFPHRRFKEVLASEALRKENFFSQFIDKVKQRNLSEFVLFVFQKHESNRDVIIRNLLENNNTEEESIYSNQLIINILEQNQQFHIDIEFINYVKKVLTENSFVWINKKILIGIEKSYTILEKFISTNFEAYVKKLRLNSLITSCEILEEISPNYISILLTRDYNVNNVEARQIIKKFKLLNLLNSDNQGEIKAIFDLEYNIDELIVLSTIKNNRLLEEEFFRQIFESMEFYKSLIFLFLIEVNNQNLYNKIKNLNAFEEYTRLKKIIADRISFNYLNESFFEGLRNRILYNDDIIKEYERKRKLPAEEKSLLENLKQENADLRSFNERSKTFDVMQFNKVSDFFEEKKSFDFSYLSDRLI